MDNKRRLAILSALVVLATACTVQPSTETFALDATVTTRSERLATPTSGEETFDDFVERSFQNLLLRYPENVTAFGLSSAFGTRDNLLNDLSESYERETAVLTADVLNRLTSFDEASLTPDQLVTRDSFVWYLETEIARYEYRLHDWPVHFLVTGYNQGVIGLFTEVHPLQNRNQVDDYLERLGKVDEQVDQLIENLNQAVEAGITPPAYVVDITVSQLRGDVAGGKPKSTLIYQSASDRIKRLGLNKGNTASYLDDLEAAISDSFIPAWERLVGFLESIRPETTNEISAARLPRGADFYIALLRRHTSTELSPEQIHAIGRQQATRITEEMLDLGKAVGLEGSDIGALREHFVTEAGTVPADEVVGHYQAIIDEAKTEFGSYFTNTPNAELEVVSDLGPGAFYIGPASDGSRPGAFHVGTGGGSVAAYQTRSLAYHEAIPGHHFQISLAQEADLPSPQRYLTNTGQVEGWALYAERLASDIGTYATDRASDFGRLDYELLRAARLIVDTGIHHLGWSRDEAIDHMTGLMGGTDYNHEVDRYVVYPGQATAYMVGMLSLLEMRDAAGVNVADLDAVSAFHDQIIGSGNVPLSVLESQFAP